jgi:hypothetical protein
MKKSSVRARTVETGPASRKPRTSDLHFPVAPEFVSRPPHLDPQLMLRRCARTMSWRNSRPGAKQCRLAEKIAAEFVL